MYAAQLTTTDGRNRVRRPATAAALGQHGSLTDGFVAYRTLTDDDKRTLTDLINALAEPLSRLTATVLQ